MKKWIWLCVCVYIYEVHRRSLKGRSRTRTGGLATLIFSRCSLCSQTGAVGGPNLWLP